MAYSYKYTPKGKDSDLLIDWLKSQDNKAESLNLLILRAYHETGNADIVDVMKNSFLNGQINHQSNSPVQPTPQNIPEESPKPQKPQPKSAPIENEKPKTKPNLGFLSNS